MNAIQQGTRGLRCLSIFAALVACGLAIAPSRTARACGCFVPPDLRMPLVQAGEEILFVVENGKLEMHVKIAYSGPAGDFGWLVPLPAVPTNSAGMQGIDVGTDELFFELESRTQPTFGTRVDDFCQRRTYGCGSEGSSGSDTFGSAYPVPYDPTAPSPLVKQDSVGPYDYAILRADDKSAMLKWLSDYRYVVPSGTDQAVNAYIRPGAYFLALRLRSGATAGDLQPVVLSFPADLPMIPITLTAVGATPNMGILVWVLGAARAIPRNYQHVILNDSKIDWLSRGPNYSQLVTQAVGEAAGKHGFVTEYAGSVNAMQSVLDTPGRFDVLQLAQTLRDPVEFIETVLPVQNATQSPIKKGFAPTPQLVGVLSAHIPMPQTLVNEGVTTGQYYLQIRQYLKTDRAIRPTAYADIETKLAAFDPAVLARDLTDRIAIPTLRIGNLLSSGRLPKLTRLYTTMSPEDMTVDPVFAFNSELPDVARTHTSGVRYDCDSGYQLHTEQDFLISGSTNVLFGGAPMQPGPAALRLEILRETGQPEIVVDNTVAIKDALGMAGSSQGCATAEPRRSIAAPWSALSMLVIALLFRRVRRVRLMVR